MYWVIWTQNVSSLLFKAVHCGRCLFFFSGTVQGTLFWLQTRQSVISRPTVHCWFKNERARLAIFFCRFYLPFPMSFWLIIFYTTFNCWSFTMNFTNATHYPTLRRGSQSPPAENLSVATKQAVYWAVATIALVGNLFFCTSLLKQRRTIFRKPYTIIVFSLALTDIITSILLFISPRFVFQDTFPQPSSMVGLRFFCVLIWGRTPLFCFALVSMYLTILLTVDRWFAVVRPTEYHTRFTRKKALASIALLSAVAIMVMVGSTPKFHFYAEKPPGQRCGFAKINPGRFQVTSTVSFVFKTVLPFLAIAALYIHMWYKLKTSSLVTQQHSPAIKKRITKVAAMSTLLLFISWTPNQVTYS